MRLKLYRGWWYAVETRDGRTYRRSLRTQDRDIATQRLADLRSSGPRVTVAEIMQAYLTEKDATAAASDRLHYAWDRLRETFGPLRPDQVTREGCRTYAAKRRKQGVADSTIQKELRTLRAALRWHDRNTPAQFDMPSSAPPKNRSLTRKERDRLVKAATAPHVRLFVILAVGTASRSEALLSLTWDRVDFARKQIALGEGRGKGRATVPMTTGVHDALVEARALATSNYVIEYAGDRVRSIKKGFAAACKRARLEDVTPHTLRHTAAVWMAEAGRPMSEIAQYLGHSDSRVTERVYARYSPDYLREAAKALE